MAGGTVTHRHVATTPNDPAADVQTLRDWNDGHDVTVTHAQLDAIGTDDHHARQHAVNGTAHTGVLDDAQIPAAIARDTEVTAAVTAHEGAADPHPVYLTAVEGNAAYDAAGAAAAAQAASQPSDADLTAIAALATTAFGRSLLTLANAAALAADHSHGIQATVDFGFAAGQEGDVASVTVAAPSVTAASVIVCTPAAAATADHDAEDAVVEGLTAYPTNIVAGVGFDIEAYAPGGTWGRYLVNASVGV